ncbi:MAG: tetratricopeptide repeat protein [Alphaproteobacteria bacterium]|nr:tetratricopeptide repeat protein [Alphaproteobacteria bacterium]
MASATPEFPPFLALLPGDEPCLPSGTPEPAALAADAALALREAGLAGAALDRLIAAARHDPADAETHVLLGETQLELGHSTAGADSLERAIALDPGALRLRQGWAAALAQSGRPAAAIAAYDHLLALRPGEPRALKAQARLLVVTAEKMRAIERYRDLCMVDRGDAEALVELGCLLITQDAAPEAVQMLQRALRLIPDQAAAHHHLGRAWSAVGEPEKAAQSLERALDLDPEDRLGSRPALAALSGDGLPASYVRHLFDQYAEGFDTALLGTLDYQGPGLLRGALDRLLPAETTGLATLDLGCGTGLIGRAVKPFTSYLEGVDLAPRMIEQAARTGLYDRLAVGDAVAALHDGRRWDLILAGDVLVYIGDLAPLVEALAVALTPGGLFLATIEALPAGDDAPFRLKPSRRFGHGESYIAGLAKAQGLTLALFEPAILRQEKRQPIDGIVFALRR